MFLNKSNQECVIFISSCDAFEDAWDPFFILFFRYWPDCPFKICLISNYKIYYDSRVKTVAIGEDKKWAANFRIALKKNWHPYLIYFQEDYFFKNKVNAKRILELLAIIKKENAACIRLRPSPGPDKPYKNYKDLGEINKGAKYSFSTQATIWNSDILYNLLRDGESGWDMELKTGIKRIKKINKPFLCVKKPAIDYFATAIKKGRWYYDAVKLCEKEGIKINKSKRPIEPYKRYIIRKLQHFPLLGTFFQLKRKILH